ncbi:MAG: PDDEXK nuclease domain-containing protein [Verrucomicrobiae bacterium]|nr:PDDEXK nuclease domain-containing protein [Verrucomicrobiae bacterium]
MPKKFAPIKVATKKPARLGAAGLLSEVRGLILAAREQVARAVDSGLVTLYWHIGRRVHQDILKEKRAEYAAEIVATLSRQLETEFGRGFSEKSLRHMLRFAEAFPDERIVSALRRQLGWTHFKSIIYLEDPLKRDFYAEMCRIEKWSTRTLEKKIGGMLYERTALSKKPDKLIRQELAALREEDKLTPDLVFRDPYVLDFLRLRDTYAERDLEAAILREMESFILELGVGFAFLERQKRIMVDSEDHYLDLLFYHRHLRRLVAIDLKLREFKPGDKGQMELYLRWLDRHERKSGEEAPIGLILCAGQRQETVELLDLEKSGIRVSSYWTNVLPKEQLQKKLHEAVRLARARLVEKTETKKTSPKRRKL